MKSMVSLILIVCFVLGFAAQNSVRAEDFDPCKEPKDDTACSLISIAKLSKDLTDYVRVHRGGSWRGLASPPYSFEEFVPRRLTEETLHRREPG